MALKWPQKDPAEVLDYSVEFDDWLLPGRNLANPTITNIEASNGESPVALNVVASSPLLGISGDLTASPHPLDTIIVWLDGGTNDVTYTLTLEADDDQASPLDRHVVRRVSIKVKEK
jgi:hypothetical protein